MNGAAKMDNQNNDYKPELSQDELAEIERKREQRRKLDQRRRDRMEAYAVMIIFALLVIGAIVYFSLSGKGSDKNNADSADNSSTAVSSADTSSAANDSSSKAENASKADSSAGETSSSVADVHSSKPDQSATESSGHSVEVKNGITYIDGIMIVNKTYSIPSTYAPGLDADTSAAFEQMTADAYADGIVLFICSGYRSYQEQEVLYNGYASSRGADAADQVSSRPGHSEHQTGLCIDVNTTEFSFEGTPEAVWLEEHCQDYGFIIRFPKGKESITGYSYEPWHIRYVGVDAAKDITAKGVCLEEYLGVTSDYADCKDETAPQYD